MSHADHHARGDWNAICDYCGGKFKASELRLQWDGLRACSKDFSARHPQDNVRARADRQNVPWTRPESSDRFLGTTEVTADDL